MVQRQILNSVNVLRCNLQQLNPVRSLLTLNYLLLRTTVGLCGKRQDLSLGPVEVPSAVEHQGFQCRQSVAGFFAPLHSKPFLPLSDEQVGGLLDMAAAARLAPATAPSLMAK